MTHVNRARCCLYFSTLPAGRSRTVPALALAGFSALLSAQAQTPPDAATLQRGIERQLQAPPQTPPPSARPPHPIADDAKATRVLVRGFVVDGATLIPAQELVALLADLVGQQLSLAQLDDAAQRLVRRYREGGWFVRAYLPQQDVSEGRIRIQVVEGRFGGVVREPGESRADADFVGRVVANRLVEGAPLSAADLERGLLLANDLPGIDATGVLEPGTTAGSTQLRLRVRDEARVRGDVGLSNSGVKSTGTWQALGSVALNNSTGRGDQLLLRLLAAERLGYAQLGWQQPLGTDGLQWGLQASHLRYKLGEQFEPLDASGNASVFGTGLQWAWLRQSGRNLTLLARVEHRRYADDMLDAATRRHRVTALNLGLQGDARDFWGGGGSSWGSVQLALGHLRIVDVAGDAAADAAGPRAAGDYARLSLQAGRLQALGAGFRLQGTLSGQWASGNMGPSEKFALGGPNGVRAYPVNEGTGDQGGLLRLELQRPLAPGWLAQAFFDAGWVQQHKNAWAGWQGGSGQPNRYSLRGTGLGLGWQSEATRWGRWRLTASVATPVGHNPGRDASGRNNDGSRASAVRWWLGLAMDI